MPSCPAWPTTRQYLSSSTCSARRTYPPPGSPGASGWPPRQGRARGPTLGSGVWTRRDAGFPETELLMGRHLADQAALSWHDAYLSRREAATAGLLQGDMATVRPPGLPGIEIAHRYLPASPAARA